MQRKWVGKNVDLPSLVKCIEDFFMNRGFKTRRDGCAEEQRIQASLQNNMVMHGGIEVVISGKSNDFIVQLIGSERVHSSIKLGFLTSMLGGGSILLRSLRSREILDRFEKEFWVYVEEMIARLVNSARHPK